MNVSEARAAVRQFESELSVLLPSIQEANRGLTMFTALQRQLGVTGDVWELIAVFQQVRLSAEMAIRGIYMVYTATGPVGWAIGGMGIAMGVLSAMSIRRPRY